jgi:hypothetical protein
MKVIKPKSMTDAMLAAASIAEPATGETAWNAATAYAQGDRAIRTQTHRIYERLVAGTTATAPELDSTNWLDVGPTNRWAMFDEQVSTASQATSSLSVTVNVGYVNSVAAVGLVGSSLTVTLKDSPGGTTVYTVTKALDGTIILDWFGYFFEPFVQLGEVVLTDLPLYLNGQLVVTLTGGGAVAIGNLVFGQSYDLGEAEYGATAGITDYSVKQTDEFGITTFVPRTFAKRMTARMFLDAVRMNGVQRVLSDIRATPCIWIGADDPIYAPLVVYGWYRDFSIDVAYPTTALVSLEVEGLT